MLEILNFYFLTEILSDVTHAICVLSTNQFYNYNNFPIKCDKIFHPWFEILDFFQKLACLFSKNKYGKIGKIAHFIHVAVEQYDIQPRCYSKIHHLKEILKWAVEIIMRREEKEKLNVFYLFIFSSLFSPHCNLCNSSSQFVFEMLHFWIVMRLNVTFLSRDMPKVCYFTNFFSKDVILQTFFKKTTLISKNKRNSFLVIDATSFSSKN